MILLREELPQSSMVHESAFARKKNILVIEHVPLSKPVLPWDPSRTALAESEVSPYQWPKLSDMLGQQRLQVCADWQRLIKSSGATCPSCIMVWASVADRASS